jgi:hypothetical protein
MGGAFRRGDHLARAMRSQGVWIAASRSHLLQAVGGGQPCLCEHLSVTSQGHAYSRFRQALDRHNLIEARSAAAEREHVGLTEAPSSSFSPPRKSAGSLRPRECSSRVEKPTGRRSR